MVTTIEISGYMESALDALVLAGIYSSKTEAVRDAIRRLLDGFDMKEVAVKAYKNGAISVQLAAEISGLSLDETVWLLISKDVAPELGVRDESELSQSVSELRGRDVLVLDLTSVYSLLELGLVDVVTKLGKRVVMPEAAKGKSQAMIMKFSKLRGLLVALDGLETVKVSRNLGEFSRKNGITVQEAHAIYIAKKMNGVLVSDDARARRVARGVGVPSAPTLAVLVLARDVGVLADSKFREALARMGALPLMVPQSLLSS